MQKYANKSLSHSVGSNITWAYSRFSAEAQLSWGPMHLTSGSQEVYIIGAHYHLNYY